MEKICKTDSNCSFGQECINLVLKEYLLNIEEALGAPEGLNIINDNTAAEGGAVRLNWNPVSGVDGYEVYWGEVAGGYSQTKDVGNVTNIIIDGLSNGCSLDIVCDNEAGCSCSNASGVVCNVVEGEEVCPLDRYHFAVLAYYRESGVRKETNFSRDAVFTPYDAQYPSNSTGLEAISGNGIIDLVWNENDLEEGVVKYDIYWGIEAGSYSMMDSSTSAQYQITSLENDRIYYIAIKSIDQSGNESDFSIEVSAMPIAE